MAGLGLFKKEGRLSHGAHSISAFSVKDYPGQDACRFGAEKGSNSIIMLSLILLAVCLWPSTDTPTPGFPKVPMKCSFFAVLCCNCLGSQLSPLRNSLLHGGCYCSCRGWGMVGHNNLKLQFQGILCPLLTSVGSRHTGRAHAHACRQNPRIHKIKYINLKQ